MRDDRGVGIILDGRLQGERIIKNERLQESGDNTAWEMNGITHDRR